MLSIFLGYFFTNSGDNTRIKPARTMYFTGSTSICNSISFSNFLIFRSATIVMSFPLAYFKPGASGLSVITHLIGTKLSINDFRLEPVPDIKTPTLLLSNIFLLGTIIE